MLVIIFDFENVQLTHKVLIPI